MVIDFATGFTIIGALVVIAGFLLQAMRKPDNQWKDELNHLKTKSLEDDNDLNLKLTEIGGEVKGLQDTIIDFKKKLYSHEQSDDRNFAKLEEKLDKLTDLIIKMINEK